MTTPWALLNVGNGCIVVSFILRIKRVVTLGNYVHPRAKDFQDFLRLLLACGHTAALEQAWCWDKVIQSGAARSLGKRSTSGKSKCSAQY